MTDGIEEHALIANCETETALVERIRSPLAILHNEACQVRLVLPRELRVRDQQHVFGIAHRVVGEIEAPHDDRVVAATSILPIATLSGHATIDRQSPGRSALRAAARQRRADCSPAVPRNRSYQFEALEEPGPDENPIIV